MEDEQKVSFPTVEIITSDFYKQTQRLFMEVSEELKQKKVELATAQELIVQLEYQLSRLQPDSNTGLMSSVVFEDMVARFVSKFERDNHGLGQQDAEALEKRQVLEVARPFCLLYIDLDRYSLIDDKFGEKFSQFLIRYVAESISKKIRAFDFACRCSESGFFVLLPETDISGAIICARDIARRVATMEFQIEKDQEPVKVTLTTGLVDFRPGMDAQTLMKKSACAVDFGREQGSNCTVVLTKSNEYMVMDQFVS